MWTTEYIIAQIFGLLAFIFLGITYLIKNRNLILIFCMTGAVFFLVHYSMLGAWSGVAVNIVNIIRAIILFLDDKNNRTKNIFSLSIILILLAVAGIVTINDWTGIIAIVAGIICTFSLWQKDIFVYRILSAVVNTLWLIYDCIFLSIIAICFDCTTILVSIIGCIMFVIYKRKSTPKDETIQSINHDKINQK